MADRRAKDPTKKEFDEDSKLGFMRVIQVYNILVILLVSVALLFVRGSQIAFSLDIIINVVILVAQGAVVWLIAQRKLYTRQIVIGIQLLEIACVLFQNITNGSFNIVSDTIGCLPNIGVILYFAFSRRAKAVLVQPWSSSTLEEEQEKKNRSLWDPKSAEFWMRLAIYFFAFSIMGHWMEMGVQILVANGLFPGTLASPDSLTWRDSLNPFPIYGIAVVICGLALFPVFQILLKRMPKRWQAYTASFLVNTLFCVVAELVLGFLFNADYHAWDYRDQFLNFQGQICLVYTLAFGIASSIITWFVYPLMERRLSMLKRDTFHVVFIACCVLYLLIFITYNIDPAIIFSS